MARGPKPKFKVLHGGIPPVGVSVMTAAEMLDVCETQIRKLIRTGSLPHFLVGRCLRIPLKGLQNLQLMSTESD